MTAAEFNQGFYKFKTTKPGHREIVTAAQLAEWREEYFQMVLRDEWKRGMLEALHIIKELPEWNDADDLTEEINQAIKDSEPK